MSWFENRNFAGRAAIAVALVLGLATPVVAGTVYSWRSDDGTLSFTDEAKRIPERYRDEAKKQSLKKLEGYRRYTPAGRTAEGNYAERLQRRQAEMQPARSAGELGTRATTAREGHPLTLGIGGSRYGGSSVSVPLDSAGPSAPVRIESERVKPADSNATRHVKIVRQGERTLLVAPDEPAQQSYRGAGFPAPSEEEVLSR